MLRVGNHFLFSPSDLTNFIGCEHLTQLEIAVALGEAVQPAFKNAYADLIGRKGEEHERLFLETLTAAGHIVTLIGLGEDLNFQAAAEATAAAVRAGVDYVHQAVFFVDGWCGVVDFLERVERPSALGAWSYVVLDTKLARHPRPEHAIQLCFYSQCLASLQSLEPDVAYIVLGTRDRLPVRLVNVSAYYRRLRRHFESAVASRAHTTPYPVDHCSVCGFYSDCYEWWERQDHLTRVAGIRHDQVNRLMADGIRTLTDLGRARPDFRIPKMAAPTLDGLREQAALQLERSRSERVPYRTRPIEEGRGFAALPRRSPGDMILDLEGHPFYEPGRGLEFLFGVLTLDGGTPQYHLFWAHNRQGERHALESVVDLAHERLQRYPDLHIYHFGVYEEAALKRLMGEYATREFEVDELLRRKVFVDLHTVVRQALRAGVRSYSLKELEPLIGFTPSANVQSGMDAILEYERWLATKDDACLTEIAAYNEDDCRGTMALLDWLHQLRPAGLSWPELPQPKPPTEAEREAAEARQRLRKELVEGAEPRTPRWMAGELLEYHRREARPAWWWYFERCGLTPEELVDDTEAIGCLETDAATPPESDARSLVHTFTFPPQDHKLGPGGVEDPATGQHAGEIVEIDDAAGKLRLRRGPRFLGQPLPRALIAGGPLNDRAQRDAVFRFAESTRDGDGRYLALRTILGRDYPHVQGRARGDRLHTSDLEEMKRLAACLDNSYLFVQGPRISVY